MNSRHPICSPCSGLTASTGPTVRAGSTGKAINIDIAAPTAAPDTANDRCFLAHRHAGSAPAAINTSSNGNG